MMKHVVQALDKLALASAGAAIILMVLLTFQQVVARYLFKESSVAMQELLWHLFGFSFLITAGVGLRCERHVRVDVFYSRLNRKKKCFVDSLGLLLFLFPSMVILIWYGVQDVMQTRSIATGLSIDVFTRLFDSSSLFNEFATDGDQFLNRWIFAGEGSPDPGGLPARWVIKSFLPLGATFCLIAGCSQLVKNIAELIGKGSDGTQ